MDTQTQNNLASHFKSLHIPSQPLLLCNVYDAVTATEIARNPKCKAIATASYAVAESLGVRDNDLSLEQNLRAVKDVATAIKGTGKPLTVDLQGGYGERLEEAVEGIIKAGAVGCNIEDSVEKEGKHVLIGVEEAAERVKRVLKVAEKLGINDFVINARADALLAEHPERIEEAIKRGRKYLEAGATCIFVFGKMSREEADKLVKELGGKVNLGLRIEKGQGFSLKDMKEIGVARVSLGPQLMFVGLKAIADKAGELFDEL